MLRTRVYGVCWLCTTNFYQSIFFCMSGVGLQTLITWCFHAENPSKLITEHACPETLNDSQRSSTNYFFSIISEEKSTLHTNICILQIRIIYCYSQSINKVYVYEKNVNKAFFQIFFIIPLNTTEVFLIVFFSIYHPLAGLVLLIIQGLPQNKK